MFKDILNDAALIIMFNMGFTLKKHYLLLFHHFVPLFDSRQWKYEDMKGKRLTKGSHPDTNRRHCVSWSALHLKPSASRSHQVKHSTMNMQTCNHDFLPKIICYSHSFTLVSDSSRASLCTVKLCCCIQVSRRQL